MSKRAHALAWMRIAGYHEDTRAFTRLFIESRIARPVADDAFNAGRRARAAGMACHCLACKEGKPQ